MAELDRYMYKVIVAALQETQWFGNGVYQLGESMALVAGREVPQEEGVRRRGEDVAIVLSGPAMKAWRSGSNQWKAWNSKLATCSYTGN